MSIITSLLTSIFGKEDFRVLFLGLDAAGRTTALYKLKLGENVTTIPTIGFNVETVEVEGGGRSTLTIWDVGGCDKIRPLWRHYYQGLQGVVFFIDGNDRERLMVDGNYQYTASQLLEETMSEEILQRVPLLVFVNKQDLPDCLSADAVAEIINIRQYQRNGRFVHIMGCCARSGEGLLAGLQWLVGAIHSEAARRVDTAQTPSTVATSAAAPTEEQIAAKRMEDMMTEWLERYDEPDDDFLQQLEDATLPSWDHRTHLRIAWLMLSRYGRREGMTRIFSGIKSFIERSPRTSRGSADNARGTTFHETMTYFWTHMVDYGMHVAKNPDNSFKHFLLFNPHLCNGGLFLHYYSKQLMLMNPDARTMVLLPDVRPLPSLLQPVESSSLAHGTTSLTVPPLHERLQPRAPFTDEEFLVAFRNQTLPSWGHDSKIRLIYLLLTEKDHQLPVGRRNADKILDGLKSVEKENFRLTDSYFWMQMVSYYVAVMKKDMGIPVSETPSVAFEIFYRRPICQALRNQLLIDKYFSAKVIDSPDAAQNVLLPDLKPFPSIVL